MSENYADSAIYFIHIQKTSGTSIRFFFELGFGRDNCLWHSPRRIDDTRDNLQTIADESPERFDKYRVIGGHVTYSRIPARILAKNPIFVSSLRDPVARVVSHYQHIRSSPEHGLRKHIDGKTLMEAMNTPGFRKASNRVQISSLCGEDDLDSLRAAMGRHKYVIGKQENMEGVFSALTAAFGLPPRDEVRVNVGAPGYAAEIERQPDYEQAVRLIRRLNQDEYTFYNSFGDLWSNL